MTKPTSEQVTFLAAGTGASDRTVLSKLRDIVSVKDFGAVGDGVADDTAAFNAAWTASNPNPVFVPSGSYAVTGTISGQFFSFGSVTPVGGTIPADDIPQLKELGVAEVFTPGTPTQAIIDFISGSVQEREPR